MLLVWIILSLLFSALFSGSEIAFVSANKLKIELKKKRDTYRAIQLTSFYDKPADFMSTMLVGNNIALVIFTSLITIPLTPFLQSYLGLSGEGFLSLFVLSIIITMIVLVFGEFLPKTMFQLFADDILYHIAVPLRMVQMVLLIPSWVMTKTSEALLRIVFKQNEADQVEETFTRLDLESFINRTGGGEGVEEIDTDMFGKALNLKDVRVRECMVPRTEIENVDADTAVSEVEQVFIKTRLSRLLVTDGEIDKVLGYVHHQQLLELPEKIREIILPIPFVPDVTRVTDLMNKFIKESLNIACVVDEFGGVSGVITLEDILEEIFGEIEDEYDKEDHIEQKISETEYRFSGRLEIDYLNEKYKLQFPTGDYHTLSGYLVMTTETIPEQGDVIEMEGYSYVFEKVSNTRVETIQVTKLRR